MATTQPASPWSGENGGLNIRRAPGKLRNLEESIRITPLDGVYGIGHTRWATHGRPTEENAHPHRDCTGEIVVVHNGIIENYLELKHQLIEEGHKFVTETDTEIIAHLIEKYSKDTSLEEAVLKTVKVMSGAYALVALSTRDPLKIVAARLGPPIVVGLGENEFFVASDIPAILQHTRNVFFLGDGEVAVLTPQGVRLMDFESHAINRPVQHVTWDPIMAEKGGFKHFMQKEIFEQPRAVRDTLLGRISQETGKVFLDQMDITEEEFREFSKRQAHRLRHQLACCVSRKIHDREVGADCRLKWTTAASFVIAIPSSTVKAWRSPSASLEKPPIRWPPSAKHVKKAPRFSGYATWSAPC